MQLGLPQINLIVWAKSNAGMGSLYRSQHELLPLFKKGEDPHRNNMLGRTGRWRSNLWLYPVASSLGSDARNGLENHPTVTPTVMLADALLDVAALLGAGRTQLREARRAKKYAWLCSYY
jgi:hypothetical protein